VLTLLLLGLRSCVGGGGGDAPGPTPSPTSGPTASPSPTAGTASSAQPTTQPTTRPTGTAAGQAPVCPDARLSLTTSTDAESYPAGARPKITLVVRNTGSTPCRRDVGAGAVELLVTSGSDRIWSSDDCNPSTAADVTLLAAGGSETVVKTWPGVRSKAGCPAGGAAARPGTYRVVARVGTLTVQGVVFRLT
jgi:hypothetical protein